VLRLLLKKGLIGRANVTLAEIAISRAKNAVLWCPFWGGRVCGGFNW
jgi:hypothetical protein